MENNDMSHDEFLFMLRNLADLIEATAETGADAANLIRIRIAEMEK